jgi:hypothetical protein
MSFDRRESRLQHLEQLLLWEGRLRRSRLIKLHGLGEVRASEWLRELREAHPDWVRWDSRERSYFATPEAYREAKATEAAAAIGGHGGGVAGGGAPLLAGGAVPYIFMAAGQSFPAISVLPWEFARPEPQVFAALRMAIEDGACVRFAYRSMGTPEPHDRIVEPHALVRAGRRWHVRGYCPQKEDFRDFVLGRMASVVRLGQERVASPEDDRAWNTLVQVRLQAHPALSRGQEEVVRMEYFAGTSARVETCRGALVPYFVQEVRAATDLDRQRPPDFQLAVANLQACQPWLFPA